MEPGRIVSSSALCFCSFRLYLLFYLPTSSRFLREMLNVYSPNFRVMYIRMHDPCRRSYLDVKHSPNLNPICPVYLARASQPRSEPTMKTTVKSLGKPNGTTIQDPSSFYSAEQKGDGEDRILHLIGSSPSTRLLKSFPATIPSRDLFTNEIIIPDRAECLLRAQGYRSGCVLGAFVA